MTNFERESIIRRSGLRPELVESIRLEEDGAFITYRYYYGEGDHFELLVHYLPAEKRIGAAV